MRLHGRRLCRLGLGGVALLIACVKSPAAKARDAAAKQRSWRATVRLLEEQQARGAVPGPYARQVLRAAEEERARATTRLRRVPR